MHPGWLDGQTAHDYVAGFTCSCSTSVASGWLGSSRMRASSDRVSSLTSWEESEHASFQHKRVPASMVFATDSQCWPRVNNDCSPPSPFPTNLPLMHRHGDPAPG